MPQPARLAIGTVQMGVNRHPVLWGLFDLWRRQGLQVQPFRAHAELASSPGAEVATGRAYRHLDGGMMFPRLCGHLLQQGSRGCDLAVVDGQFNAPLRRSRAEEPDYFDALCGSLDLAGVAVVNIAQLQGGHLPRRPRHLEAVILDEISNHHEAIRWILEIESLWNVPVVGGMPQVTPLRTIAESISAEARPSPQLCRLLGDALAPHCREDRLLDLGHRSPLNDDSAFANVSERGPRIAVGIDEAMSRYFPENLEWLAAKGATLLDFSPLRAEAPPEAEIIYLADGCLQTYARQLSRNHCLLASLRKHVADGGQIYAEGMGAALLGRELLLPDGQLIRMAGVMPWSYRLLPPANPQHLRNIPHEEDNWLIHGCPHLRGYEGCSRLRLLIDAETSSPTEETSAHIYAWRGAVASTIPLFFPAHPRVVRNLLRMHWERVEI